MRPGIESLVPPALGTILLILLMGAFFAASTPVVVLLTGTLFFAGGLVFGRSGVPSPLVAGIALVAPFLFTSAFLVVKFGAPFLIFPALAVGGVASGLVGRRRGLPGAGGFILGALWVGFVIVMTFLIIPAVFDRVSFAGFAPR
jgi:hypothetical protein